MLCNRCGHELPSDTPVCPRCGPMTFGAAHAPPPPPSPLPPLPSIETTPAVIPPLPTPPAVVASASVARAPVAPARSMPATPPSASKADLKRTRKQRAREAMAARERGNEVPTAVQPEDETPLVAFERPSPLKQIAVMDFVVGGAEAVVAAATLTGHIGGATEDAVWMGLHALVLLVAAVGLWTLRPFGRYAQFAMAAAALVSGSIAMIAAIPIGIYVARPGMALLVSGREPRTLDARQRARIRQDTASPLLIPAAVGFYTLLAVTRLWSPLGALFSR